MITYRVCSRKASSMSYVWSRPNIPWLKCHPATDITGIFTPGTSGNLHLWHWSFSYKTKEYTLSTREQISFGSKYHEYLWCSSHERTPLQRNGQSVVTTHDKTGINCSSKRLKLVLLLGKDWLLGKDHGCCGKTMVAKLNMPSPPPPVSTGFSLQMLTITQKP